MSVDIFRRRFPQPRVLWFAAAGLATPLLQAQIELDSSSIDGAPRAKVVEVESANPAAEAGTARDILSFKNGDNLHGRLIRMHPEEGIQWSHPDVADPIRFTSRNVVEIVRSPPGGAGDRRHPSYITLINGDILPIDLLALTEEVLRAHTWYAGELVIPRGMINVITLHPASGDVIFSGPRGLDGWKNVGPEGEADVKAWTYRTGAFYGAGQASLAKSLNLPDKISVEFDLHWQTPNGLNLWVALYSPFADPEEEGEGGKEDAGEEKEVRRRSGRPNYQARHGACYIFNFNSSNCYLQRATAHGQNFNWTQLGATGSQLFRNGQKAHIEMLVNKEKKEFALIVDGVLMGRWKDPGDFVGDGKGIMFTQSSNGKLRLSNLNVSHWNGKIITEESLQPDKTDLARLTNGSDRISGKIGRIADGIVAISASYGELSIPIAQVADVYLSADGQETLEEHEGSMRFYFAQGGRFTVQLTELLVPDTLQASSRATGALALDLNAFYRFRFGSREDDDENWDDEGSF